MGAIAELGVPQQGAVAALPVPGATVTPQQADTAAYRATQGPLARGFRSGMNSVGAMLEGLAGQTGEVLGLTDFAQDRFNSAAEYAAMSDAVAPAVRDTSQVKDLNSFVDYVSGHIGSGAATTLPAVAAGVGFRRPVMGVMGMSSAMEAGEQVNTLRADPTVMATQTPEAILANAAKKGVIAGGLEAFGGAGGQAAKTILKGTTAGVGKNLAKGIAGEALTESGQDLTGQVLHQDLNPNKEIDLEQTFQAGAAGAAGGGGIALASQVPGAAMSVAKSGKELADRLRGPSKPRDPYGVPDNIADIKDPESLVKSLEDQENAGFEDLDKELAMNPEKYGKYKDWRKNPDQESEFIDAVMEDYAARETRPRTDRAIDEANKLLEDYDRKKYTRVETQGPETTLNKMGTDVLAGKTIHYNLRDPKVAEFLVQNGYKEDTPGVWTPVKKFSKKMDRTEADDNFHDFMMENITGMTKDRASPKAMLLLSDRLKALALNPRALEASELPAGLRRVIGDRFDKIMTEAINTFHSSEDSKQEALQILADVSQRTKGAVGGRMNAVKALIRTNLRPEYSANKELREAALGTMAERMMNYLENKGDTKSDAAFIEDAKYAFGTEKAAYVIEQLDSLIRKDEQGSYEPTGQERTIDDRLGVPMSDEKALSTFQALKEEFGPKAANLRIVSLGKNRLGNEKFSVEIEDADTVSMTEDAFNAVQESSKYNKSELKDGILTVRTDKHKSGAKVSLVKLTNLMIKKEGQQTQEGGAKYVADMFSRGMSAILSMEGFRGFTQKFEDALGGKPGEKAWTFPDDTLVAIVNGTKYYFKDIKKYELTRMELAGITAEDIKAEMARLRKTPAGQAADPRALRQVAVEIAKEKSRERAMDATLFDNWEVQQETDQTVGSAKTLAERDAPVDEEVGRTSEEDTGLPTQGRSAAAGPRGPAHGQKAPPSVRYVKGESKFIAASSKSGDIVVNLEKAAAEYDAGFPYFLGKEDSPGSKQKGVVAEQLGLTEAKLKELFPTRKDFVAFLRAHEQSHVDNGDAAKYPRTEDGKPDLMHKKAIAIEVRATKDALSRRVEPPAPTPGPGSKRPTLPEPRNSKESLGINKKPRIPGNDNALSRAEALLNKESAELMSRVVGPKPNIKFSDLRLNPGEQTEEQRQQVTKAAEKRVEKPSVEETDVFRGYKDSDVVWAVRAPASETEGGDILAVYKDAGQAQERAEALGANVENNTVANLRKPARRSHRWERLQDLRKKRTEASKAAHAAEVELTRAEKRGDEPQNSQLLRVLRDEGEASATEFMYKRYPEAREAFVNAVKAGKAADKAFKDADEYYKANRNLLANEPEALDRAFEALRRAAATNKRSDGTNREQMRIELLAAMTKHIGDKEWTAREIAGRQKRLEKHKADKNLTAMISDEIKLLESGNPLDVVEKAVNDLTDDYMWAAPAPTRRSSGKIMFSTLNIGKGPMTEGDKQAVRDYIERVLGKDRTEVLFEKLEGHSGSFEFTADGVERLMITIDTLDPMSVAYHEALHAFFKRLVASDKKAANTLLRAASSAPIVARLKELLKDHPEALKQLADPEERLAYMYQFWAAGHKGLLNVGPETRTFFGAVKSFLRKLSAIWSDEMVENMSVEEAGEILSAFHNGDFMNRSTVAQVLRDKFPESPIESARKIAPWLGRLMDKFIWTSTGAVRDMNIPALTDIMDKFHVQNTAELAGMPGFLQSKNVEFHKRLNKVIMVLKGKTEAQQKEILDELRSGKPRTSAAAQDIENILKEAFQYMKEAGVKTFKRDEDGKLVYIKGGNKPVYEELREIKTNYFPRVPDAEYIRDHKKEFVALLRKYKVHDAEAVYDKYTQDFNMGKPNEEDNVIGLTFYTPQINERSLNHIPDSELAPFMNQDLFGTMAQYLGRATRRAEYTRRFGNAGEVIQDAKEQAQTEGMTKEQARTFDEAVQALEGSLGGNMSPQLKNLYGGLMTYQNIRLLPLALFSSLIDPMGIAVRGGSLTEAFGAFKRGIMDLKSIVTDKAREDDAYMLAQTVGAIDASMDAHMMSDMYGSQYMPKTQQWINSKFFKYNGMESWNRSMRVAATAAAEQFIIRHTTKPNEHSKRYLAELGLSKGDVTIVNDRLVLNKKTEAALNLWVDQAIIRPNAALRPIYMSDPNWMLISHLKQYAYMFQKTIIARVHNEAMHGNFGPAGTMAMYVPIIIASDMLRATLTPGSGDDERMKNWTMADWLWRGVQRAGLFGPGQFVLDSGQDLSMNKLGVESMAGPTVQQLMDFARGTATGSVSNELLKAVPGARVFQ